MSPEISSSSLHLSFQMHVDSHRGRHALILFHCVQVAAPSKAPQTPTTPQMVLEAPMRGSATNAAAVMPVASPTAFLTPARVQLSIVPPADTPIATGPGSARALFQDQATFALEPAQVHSSYLLKLYLVHNLLPLYVQVVLILHACVDSIKISIVHEH